MADGYVLSEEDVKTLRWMKNFIETYRHKIDKAYEDPSPKTSQTYIARLPIAGIPAMEDRSSMSQADRPGVATCPIYKLAYDDDVSAWVFEPIGRTEEIYNISEITLRCKYARITLDKFGKWIADAYSRRTTTGTGTSSGTTECINTINGQELQYLSITTTPDYALVLKDGCIALADIGDCEV